MHNAYKMQNLQRQRTCPIQIFCNGITKDFWWISSSDNKVTCVNYGLENWGQMFFNESSVLKVFTMNIDFFKYFDEHVPNIWSIMKRN